MFLRRAVPAVIAVCTVFASGTALAQGPIFTPGAPGAGDPYFPLDGNGGYDVDHYLLEVRYDPATDRLNGRATITAHATQNLSRFNLDLDGLSVESITVDGRSASYSRNDGELTIIPRHGLSDHARFVVVVDYRGVPEPPPDDSLLGASGFIHTDDGAVVAGQPHVAATWFPANDHPADSAAFTFKVTVPEGLEVVANGALVEQRTRRGWTTWVWDAKDQMATYLAGMVIGELEISSYQHDRIRYWDAIDPDLFTPIEPVTGSGFAISQQADASYKRLSRVLSVPAEGAELSFWVTRDTEQAWDFFFVEAHTVGLDDWTTLPDVQGVATQDVGLVCPYWHELHPFLQHYQTATGTELEPCAPSGDTGEWWAASGASNGAEQWTVDLSAWAGTQVEVALSYASDDVFQIRGVFVDDIVVSTGEGSTSFEDDGDVLDGWTVPGPPEGSPNNQNDWIVGTAADAPSPPGEIITASLARQPEIISFLEQNFGRYPFDLAGGIIDDASIGFALENQTRPIYDKAFFSDSESGASVIVHELAHQWFGDSLRLKAWQDIWLNEGFATYAEWLWSEHEGLASTQEIFDSWFAIDAESPFWTVVIGDPGPDLLFDNAVYGRGAMTLHELRKTVGDETFFRILRSWARSQAGGTVTTDEFIELAERISDRQLDQLFDVWLFVPAKPNLETAG